MLELVKAHCSLSLIQSEKRSISSRRTFPAVDYAETLRAMCERAVRKFGIRCLVRMSYSTHDGQSTCALFVGGPSCR